MGVEDTVKRLWEEQQKLPEVVAQQVPPKYQPFVCWLEQNKQVSASRLALTPELRAMGVYVNDRGTFMSLRVPYMTVEGRMLWFADAHREAKAKFSVSSNIEALAGLLKNGDKPPVHYPLVVWIDSEIFGRLEGVSRIFWDGSGASRTNPLETAYTSALGRAIAQAGIGLIGTGVASAEEIEAATAAAGVPEAAVAPPPQPPQQAQAEGAAPAEAGTPAAQPSPARGKPGARAATAPDSGGQPRAAQTAQDAPAPAAGEGDGAYTVKAVRQATVNGKVALQVVFEGPDGKAVQAIAVAPGAMSEVYNAYKDRVPVRPKLVRVNGTLQVEAAERVVA